MKSSVLKIHERDNVLVALDDLTEGQTIHYKGIHYELKEDVPAKHKFFMQNLQKGDEIIMYGVLVGKAQDDLQAGMRMTTANTKHASGSYGYRGVQYQWQRPDTSRFEGRT